MNNATYTCPLKPSGVGIAYTPDGGPGYKRTETSISNNARKRNIEIKAEEEAEEEEEEKKEKKKKMKKMKKKKKKKRMKKNEEERRRRTKKKKRKKNEEEERRTRKSAHGPSGAIRVMLLPNAGRDRAGRESRPTGKKQDAQRKCARRRGPRRSIAPVQLIPEI